MASRRPRLARARPAQTITQLENDDWGEPWGEGGLDNRVRAARRIRLSEMEIGQLRMCVDQGVGLPWVLPLVVGLVHDEPLIDGDYPGSLLCALLRHGEFGDDRAFVVDAWRRARVALLESEGDFGVCREVGAGIDGEVVDDRDVVVRTDEDDWHGVVVHASIDGGDGVVLDVDNRVGAVVGSDAGVCDLVCADEAVARRHALLFASEDAADKVELVDLGSATGTVVNGVVVTRALVGAGDVVEVGRHVLRVRKDPRVGRVIGGRFEVRSFEGRGRCEVYGGVDVDDGADVVVKVVEGAAADEVDRLAAVFAKVAAFAHDGAVRVRGHGVDDDGALWFAADALAADLRDRSWRTHADPEMVVAVVGAQLCDVIAAAHDEGIVHGGLGLACVHVSGGGRVVVSDFGVEGGADDVADLCALLWALRPSDDVRRWLARIATHPEQRPTLAEIAAKLRAITTTWST